MEKYEFEWDDANVRHIARHGVTPEEAEDVVKRSPIEVEYQLVDGEERIELLGMTRNIRLLTVVITPRSGKIRVVTAFPANPRLRATYFKAAGFLHDK